MTSSETVSPYHGDWPTGATLGLHNGDAPIHRTVGSATAWGVIMETVQIRLATSVYPPAILGLPAEGGSVHAGAR